MSNRKDHSRNERKKAKRADRRPEHTDKYAHRVMEGKVITLAAKFNGEEADHE